jgi:restriction system protein
MPVPDFPSFFKPLLEIASDGNEHSMKEVREKIATQMNLAEDDLRKLLPSGIQSKFDSRANWAASYFVKALVLERPRKAYIKITDRGRELLDEGHERIEVKRLKQYKEFLEFHTAKPDKETVVEEEISDRCESTPANRLVNPAMKASMASSKKTAWAWM